MKQIFSTLIMVSFAQLSYAKYNNPELASKVIHSVEINQLVQLLQTSQNTICNLITEEDGSPSVYIDKLPHSHKAFSFTENLICNNNKVLTIKGEFIKHAQIESAQFDKSAN